MLPSITAAVVLDVWSDLACPWCYVGMRHLDAALADLPAGEVVVAWHAFELRPARPDAEADASADAQPSPARLAALQLEHARLARVAEPVGITLRFPLPTPPTTRRAHNLVAAARAVGREHATVAALFAAHFEQGRDIAAVDDLLEVAQRTGLPLDHAELEGWLRDGAFDAAVEADEAAARRLGVTAVPFYVANRAVSASGALPPAALARVLAAAREHPAPPLDG